MQVEEIVPESVAWLARVFAATPVATFVIDSTHRVTHWNPACASLTGHAASTLIGTLGHQRAYYTTERPTLADLIVDGATSEQLAKWYRDKRLTRAQGVPGGYEAEDFFPHFGPEGCWLFFTAAPLYDRQGKVIGAVETLQDVSERRNAEAALVKHQHELEAQVAARTAQLTQSEKLASIGQLAAGVAHEINNPIGFVHSNMGSLQRYFTRLLKVLEHFETHRELIEGTGEAGRNWVAKVEALKAEADYDYLKEDIPVLLAESHDGIERVRRIVADLKNFSRVDSGHQFEAVDLRTCLDSTLNIVMHEIKYRAEVVKEYGAIPPVRCISSQINQVFMNLMVNAAQAIPAGQHGLITLRCKHAGDEVVIEVTDNGSGMTEAVQTRIFDPFFTTKPVGSGTGLGLSLSHGIIQKHGGRIAVKSAPGAGTAFTIHLPINGPKEA